MDGLRSRGVSARSADVGKIMTTCSSLARDRFAGRVRLGGFGWIVLSSVLLGAAVIASAGTGEGVASGATPPSVSAPSVTWGARGPHNHVCEDALDGRA